MVTLPPASQTPCTAAAISAGSPANTATASPCCTPGAAVPTRYPAACKALWWTSVQVTRRGWVGSPVVMPRSDRVGEPGAQCATRVSRNLLTNGHLTAVLGKPAPDGGQPAASATSSQRV